MSNLIKADLHCHSKYSDVASTWILKAYNSPESFTEPETIYQQAKSRGMNFVTITDHDDIRGCIELQRAHPGDTFISCELTAWFPEDNCKIHILVYGINSQQYRCLMELRQNVHHLREYILEQGIAYSVAHATYDQDGKLEIQHIEKLVLLFDVFEVVNGGASRQNNVLLHRYLESLDEQTLDELQTRHGIRPASIDPWVKGYTGGSDDHCGILLGSAYTQSSATSMQEFLASIRNKKTAANGMHGSFEIYATGVIKHIHDYRADRDTKYIKTKMNDFLEMFFVGHEGNWAKRFKKSQSLRFLKRKNSRTHKALHSLLEDMNDNRNADISEKIPLAYEQVANLHDEMFRPVIKALVKNLPAGNIFKTFQQLSTLFPMLVLAAPFVGSMRHQILKSTIKQGLISACRQNYTQKALWFTDTIDDLNGVSVSLRQHAKQSQRMGYQMQLVTCVDPDALSTPLPDGTINLPMVYQERIPGYEQQQLFFPSLLKMMRTIVLEQPDQIVISTPGPVGLGAMLCAKLMDIPTKAIYHTDFAEQALQLTNEAMLAKMIDASTNAFYKLADAVYVPSRSYITKLIDSGLPPERMHIFPRGIDTELYRPKPIDSATSARTLRAVGLNGEFTLLFAGRISEDKNLGLLAKIMHRSNQSNPGRYNLVVAGDGPYLPELRRELGIQANIHFLGRIDAEELVHWYQTADLMVFPSHTDTFGMVVLEAQACGLPCLVTASGGPKEIIENNQTGQIIHSDEVNDWYEVIQSYFRLRNSRPERYAAISKFCTERVIANNSWEHIFSAVIGDECRSHAVVPSYQKTLPSQHADHKSGDLAA